MKSLTLQRIAAVDVFRALTMFLMLFVNDIPGLKNVPHWLMHARMDEDMMGFSDTIFPAFLFCMGMSVSFAIQNRYKKGDNTLQVVAHIFWRTVALIAMGLFSLNSGGIEGGLSHQWFSILMVIGFFLTWGVYPKAEGTKKTLFTAMKTAGVLLLAFLVIYKDMNGFPLTTKHNPVSEWKSTPSNDLEVIKLNFLGASSELDIVYSSKVLLFLGLSAQIIL